MKIQYIVLIVVDVIILFGVGLYWGLLNQTEGLELLNKEDAFCENHRGKSGVLEESCGKLTEKNCNSTNCCVYTSENKCVAGSAKGPTFNSDEKGKTIALDYYYYQNKCYGPKCAK
jgi:hypothetical protein